MNSIWLENKEKNEYDVLKNDIETECLIIGGGIFGTTLGYILSKNNMKVTLIERKDDLASGTTGYTTAKITSQHGRIYHYLINQFGEETARKYFQANENAVRKIQEIIQSNNIDCDFKKESSYLYSVNNDELIKLKEEYEAVKKINPKAIWVENSSLPFNILGAIEFKDQASFNPYKYVKGLAKKITENGGDIFCNTICYDLEKKDSIYICKTNSYSIKAKYVVIASHYPFLNIPGFYFSKIYQTSSYVIGLDIKKKEFDGMYINIDSPTYSFRTAKINGNTILLLGGGDHKTGEIPKEDVGYESLEKVARKWYPDCEIKYRWSTNDCISLDKIPYIGEFSKTYKNVYVATAFNKWGMTSSYVASDIISDKILGKENIYEDIFKSTRTNFFINRDEVKNMVIDTFKGEISERLKSVEDINLKKGEGKIIEIDGKKIGIYIDEKGTKYAIKPVCTHLGCMLSWNEFDKTWDCPCHGSRFTYDGKCISNPAIKDLEKIDLD